MKVGDKVRLKDSWGGETTFDFAGFGAEVLDTEEYVGNTYLKPLSDRPDGWKREEFYWPTDKVEVIEHTYKVGDKVKILSRPRPHGELDDTVSEGDIGTITDIWGDTGFEVSSGQDQDWQYDPDQIEPYTEVEVQKIEVGDKVLALHTDGTTVTGVAHFAGDEADDQNIEIALPGVEGVVGVADLYARDGWTFEVLEKKPTPVVVPKVGDNLTPNLPVGTVIVLDTNPSRVLVKSRTGKWDGDLGGDKDEDLIPDRWKIVYLPSA